MDHPQKPRATFIAVFRDEQEWHEAPFARHPAGPGKITMPIHLLGEKNRTKELLRINRMRRSTYLQGFVPAIIRNTLTVRRSFRAVDLNMLNHGGRHDA